MQDDLIQRTKEKLVEYEERHQEILNAAMRLFNANGYAATTTASIAKEARVPERTMYRHFKNKQVLFAECIFSIVGELTELQENELKENEDDSLAYLNAVTSSYVNFVINNPDKSMFLVHLYSYRGIPELDEGFRTFVASQIDDTEKAIKSMQKAKVIKSDLHSRVLAVVFIAQYFTMVFLKEFVEPEHFKVETVKELAKSFLKID